MNKGGTHIVDAIDKLDAYMLHMIRSWLINYMRRENGKPVQRITLEHDFQVYLRSVTDAFQDIVDNPSTYNFLRRVKDNKYSYLREYILDKEIKRTLIKVKSDD